MVKTVIELPGSNANAISKHVYKSKSTVERYLRIAREVGLIDFIGTPKTGGYEITEKLKKKIGA